MKVDSWSEEDFSSTPRSPKIIGDFWEPHVIDEPALRKSEILPSSLSPLPLENEFSDIVPPAANVIPQPTPSADSFICHVNSPSQPDFWDPIPGFEQRKTAKFSGNDWSDEIQFHPYDPAAQETPFVEKTYISPRETLARKCAGAILKLAHVSDRRRTPLLGRFVELFIDYPHPSSFRAIASLAREEASPEDILAAYEFRCAWTENPRYSLIRGRKGFFFIPESQSTLTWKLAYSLVVKARGTPPENLIDPSWVDEWMDLPAGDQLSFQFLSYAVARIDAFHEGALEQPIIDRRYTRWMISEAPNRPRASRWYEEDLAIKDVAMIDGCRIFNDHSRTASLTGWYVNSLGHHQSSMNKKQEDADA
ncbi:hypothetical protein HNR60_000694 [Rhodopseudomonas rhenobacensis]|uniref:Uncharacterized protein n=1 Tax=Rhodopseudomonas rhenobacensis TaxID=87461 RepID=A0A7W7Z138_9BRAD|nr:hypothetical protein [Rhodopseudomonas rhenobacensis]MBB5045959.1 hypothetical protein [Rhodopseudomonas rhenobacensis]